MTAAEELAAAADKLDALAGEATAGPWQVDGPWWWNETTSAAMVTAQPSRTAVVMGTADAGNENAAYIAAVNPLVGKALAEMLRTMAALASRLWSIDERILADALALARLINGSES